LRNDKIERKIGSNKHFQTAEKRVNPGFTLLFQTTIYFAGTTSCSTAYGANEVFIHKPDRFSV